MVKDAPFCISDENNPVREPSAGSGSSGKMTTWSNLGSRQKSESYCTSQQEQQQQHHSSRARRREENSLNNNEDSSSSSSSRKSKSLPDMARDSNRRTEDGSKLVSAFMRNKGERLSWNEEQHQQQESGPIPMMRSKDTVNQYLKSAACPPSARLTSIQEDGGHSSPSGDSTLRSDAGGAGGAEGPATPSKSKKYPDLNFLEDDVGLWDAFFLHSKNSSKHHSVLGKQQRSEGSPHHPPPPLPVEEYLQQQQRPHSAYSIQDLESLRTLLPQAHKNLLPPTPGTEQGPPPLAQVCQSLSRLHIHQQRAGSSNAHDAQNEAIKSLFSQQHQQDQVQMVKVKEAWAPEEKEKATVVLRRKKKREEQQEQEDLNLLNNNCDGQDEEIRKEERLAKRRSFHPTDHLSRAFDQQQPSRRSSAVSRRRARRPEFPKVY